MKKQRRRSGFLLFLLLVVIAILWFYYLAPDHLRSDIFLALRTTGDRIFPRLINAITSPLNSIGANIKELFGGISFR